jgi:hypothetical protein
MSTTKHVPAKCHPNRPHVAHGLCEQCYRKWVRQGKPPVAYAIADARPRVFSGISQAPTAPPPDPLEAARASRVQAAEDSRDRQALKASLSRLEILESQVENLTAPYAPPLAPVERVELASGGRQACAVALLSDVHAGADVRLTPATFGNRYNPAICRYRLGRFFAGVEWLVNSYRDGDSRYAWRIDELVLALMGDIIDGHLHEDQIERSESAITTISWVEPLLIDGILRLRDAGLRVRVVYDYGNHGRDTKKPRRATGAEHSYEWGMYNRMARVLAREGVEGDASPAAHHYADVYGRRLHFHHGDEIKYQGGVGGITIPVNKRVAVWDRVHRADLHHIGHFHQQCDHHPWFANGSVIGYNEYAMSIGAAPEPPQQTFYLLDAKRGKTTVSPIWVGDAAGEASL